MLHERATKPRKPVRVGFTDKRTDSTHGFSSLFCLHRRGSHRTTVTTVHSQHKQPARDEVKTPTATRQTHHKRHFSLKRKRQRTDIIHRVECTHAPQLRQSLRQFLRNTHHHPLLPQSTDTPLRNSPPFSLCAAFLFVCQEAVPLPACCAESPQNESHCLCFVHNNHGRGTVRHNTHQASRQATKSTEQWTQKSDSREREGATRRDAAKQQSTQHSNDRHMTQSHPRSRMKIDYTSGDKKPATEAISITKKKTFHVDEALRVDDEAVR